MKGDDNVEGIWPTKFTTKITGIKHISLETNPDIYIINLGIENNHQNIHSRYHGKRSFLAGKNCSTTIAAGTLMSKALGTLPLKITWLAMCHPFSSHRT